MKRATTWCWPAFVALAIGISASAAPGVAINEVMYHPPDDRDDLQWIEVHNGGSEPARVGGWSFTKGIKFTFDSRTVIPPGGYLVVARDRTAFTAHYGNEIPVVGEFTGRLSHNGEAIELSDSNGKPVDSLRYSDSEPWPISADGMSASLERISVGEPGTNPANWAPSELPERKSAAGTPGRRNSVAQASVPPVVSELKASPPRPNQPINVSVTIADPDGIGDVRLAWQVLGSRGAARGESEATAWKELDMARVSGTPQRGFHSATIPPQGDGRIVRFRVIAQDQTGATRIHPHPNDARPTWSVYVGGNSNDAQIPFVWLVETGPPESPGPGINAGRRSRRNAPSDSSEPARGSSAFVYMPPRGGPVQLFDHIRITPRKGGWKVRLHKDRMLEEMSTINVIFEMHPRQVLSEHLSYELYRAAGVPSPLSGHWRVWHNGRARGYHLYVEQPNSSFLRRNGRDPDGDLFKILWYGQGIEGQHEKKNNPQSGHTELISLISALQNSRGEAQWKIIEKHFNIDVFASYYAVNMCIQNWDGFFNNHFVYRAPGPDGKWEIIPWDEDKTWGDYDGVSPDYDWYTMPLNTGASDRPSSSSRSFFGMWGGAGWWRPPGWFSGPLLNNPLFRERFRKRLHELCETHFTPNVMEVPIARLQIRLEPEVRARGQGALEEFHHHIDSFRRQVTHRRAFILKELAKEK